MTEEVDPWEGFTGESQAERDYAEGWAQGRADAAAQSTRLVRQIREQLYIANRIALATLRAPEMTAVARAELAASIENELRRS